MEGYIMANGFIIDRRKTKRRDENGKEVDTMVYLLQHEIGLDGEGKMMYLNPNKGDVKNFTEPELVEYVVRNNINLVNAKINEHGKIVAKDASLNRFEQAGYSLRVRPYTVCAEIKNSKGMLLGYRVASAKSGDVKAVSVDNFITACETLIISALKASKEPKELYKPVMNMKFSPNFDKLQKKANEVSPAMAKLYEKVCAVSGVDTSGTKASFLSVYSVSNPLPVEIWEVRSNKYATGSATTPEMAKNAEKVAKKTTDIASLFTKEQLQALAEAKAKGVDIRKMANPELSANRMRVIGKLEADGFNGEQINNPAFKDMEFNYLAANIRLGVDVKEVLNPAYDTKQMAVILAAIMEGLDVNEFADPSFPHDIMAQKRRDMLDKSTWCTDLDILEGTKYTR